MARHQAESEAWEASRADMRRDAYRAAYADARRRGADDPQAASDARGAAANAVAQFERKTPPPRFAGQETSLRWFTKTAEEIKEAVR